MSNWLATLIMQCYIACAQLKCLSETSTKAIYGVLPSLPVQIFLQQPHLMLFSFMMFQVRNCIPFIQITFVIFETSQRKGFFTLQDVQLEENTCDKRPSSLHKLGMLLFLLAYPTLVFKENFEISSNNLYNLSIDIHMISDLSIRYFLFGLKIKVTFKHFLTSALYFNNLVCLNILLLNVCSNYLYLVFSLCAPSNKRRFQRSPHSKAQKNKYASLFEALRFFKNKNAYW